MTRTKVVAPKPRASAEPAEPGDPVVRAVDDVVEDAIDEMVERLAETPDARPAIDPTGKKRVRHGFTMSKDEYESLETLKVRLQRLSRPTKKGALLRAGIAVLTRMSDDRLAAAVGAVPSLKPARSTSATGARRAKK